MVTMKPRDVKLVDKRDEVRSILGWMHGDTKARPVVMDGKRPFGIPNHRSLLGRHIVPAASVGKYTLPTPVLDADAPGPEALAAFSETLAPYLPARDAAGNVGFLDPLEVLDAFDEGPTAGGAAHLVPALPADATLAQALAAFGKEPVDHLPVVGSDGRIQGVLDRRELLRIAENAGVREGKGDAAGESDSLLERAVSGFAENAWARLDADASFHETRQALRTAGYAIVPGIRDPATRRETIGIVTPAYLCRALHRMRREA